MIRTGVDIVEISRFSEMKNFDRFMHYGFTKRERKYIQSKKNPYPSAAAAFAAKEAFSKYLGSGIRGFSLKDIEILHDSLGSPYIIFMGEKVYADVSISHSESHAVATVCGEDINSTEKEGKYADLIKSYRAMLPKRTDKMHKGDCGRLVIGAGSKNMVGAACLVSKAALRCGCGLVTLAVPDCVQKIAASKLTEIMTYPLSSFDGMVDEKAAEDIKNLVDTADALAIGPGMGKSKGVKKLLEVFLKKTRDKKACIIDADGLNVLAENMDLLEDLEDFGRYVVLTPHPKEMERLCGKNVPSDKEGRISTALDFALKYKVNVLLKGSETVVVSYKGEVHINESGNDGMATAGMGDVLTGVISSFCAQGAEPYIGAVLGAFVHGLAGDIAAEDKGRYGLIAGDVAETLPYSIKFLARR